MPAPTADELYEDAAAPQSIAVDGQSISERSADDQIKLINYAAATAATADGRSAWGRVRMAKAVPPGGGPT